VHRFQIKTDWPTRPAADTPKTYYLCPKCP